MSTTETKTILKDIEADLKKCYTCNKCISGCPVAPQMEFPPSLIVKWLALGKIEKLLTSDAIWVCSSCQNCYSRCPFGINIPHIIDTLKEYAHKNKLSKKQKPVQLFHELFLETIKQFGRIHEATFIGKWKFLSGKWFSDIALGIKMFIKGKLPISPEKIKNQKELKDLFKI